MELNKDNLKKIRGLIIFTILFLVGIWKISIILKVFQFLLRIFYPFIMGGMIAFIINVPMKFLEKMLFKKNSKYFNKLKRPISLLLTIFILIGLITIFVFVIVPEIKDTIVNLEFDVQDTIDNIKLWILDKFQNYTSLTDWVSSIQINWNKIVETVINFSKSGVGNIIDFSFTTVKSIFSGLFTFFISFVFAIYVLLQKEKLRNQIKKVMNAFLNTTKVDKIMNICSLSYKIFTNFVTGQCVEAIILGLMFIITMFIVRLPYALPVGMLIAITALIPIFGAFIGLGIGTFLILTKSSFQALLFIVVFIILQQIEGNVIYPKVVGNSVGLPSIWVLVAVSIGGSIMGIWGIILFIPISSIVYTLFREYINDRLRIKNKKIENL